MILALLVPLTLAQTGLSPTLHEIVNLKAFRKAVPLSEQHLRALRRNLFFVSPGGDPQLFPVYATNDYKSLPSLVTTDNVLQLCHVFFDSTLRGAEEKRLLPDLRRLTASMLATSNAQYAKQTNAKLKAAAFKNVAYFEVASRLLGGAASASPSVANLANAEVALIRNHSGFHMSPIFKYSVDYSQFIVRGHYSRTPALGRYFSAMMWYGLVPIALESRRGGALSPRPEQVRQAGLIVNGLYSSGAISRWNKIYSVSSLYAGAANDLTPSQWKHFVGLNINSLASDAGTAGVTRKLRARFHPKIVMKKNNATVGGDLQFRFMGQRAIPDSIVFNHLTNPDLRSFPSPLDVAVALGSNRAAAILDSNPGYSNPKGWGGYRLERTRMQKQLGASRLNSNLYESSLDLMRIVLMPPPAKAPPFMHTRAWQDKSICSMLASWAELRHDTILYGMQTVAEMGDGDEQPPPQLKGYVEPNVPVYTRALAYLNQLASGLRGFGYLSTAEGGQLAAFRELLGFFTHVSDKELSGRKLTNVEYLRIRHIEGALDELSTEIQILNLNYQTLTQDDLDMAVVADVHTANGLALTVAVGHSDDLIAVVPIEGKLTLTRGTALSFYELKVPISDRMTDEAWKAHLNSGKEPARPWWVRSYFVNKKARVKED